MNTDSLLFVSTVPKKCRPPLEHIILCFMFFMSCIPFILCAPVLPFIDFPNHLARVSILTELQYDEKLREYYKYNLKPIPNIIPDIFVLLVHEVFGFKAYMTHWALLFLATISIIPASAALSYCVFGYISYVSLMSGLLIFNYVLIYGFANYIIGIPFVLISYAIWIKVRSKNSLFLLSFTCILLFIQGIHMYCFGLITIMVGIHELLTNIFSKEKKFRRLFINIIPIALNAAIFVLFSPTSNSFDRIVPSTIDKKLVSIYAIFDIGNDYITIITFMFVVMAVFCCLIKKRLSINAINMTIIVSLVVLFFVMPFTLFGSGFADFRLPIFIAIFVASVVSFQGNKPDSSPVVRKYFLIVVSAMFMMRVLYLAVTWSSYDSEYEKYLSYFDAIPQYSRVLYLVDKEGAGKAFLRKPPKSHLGVLIASERKSFVPSIFAENTKQPLILQSKYKSFAFHQAVMHLQKNRENIFHRLNALPFDYLVVFSKQDLSGFDFGKTTLILNKEHFFIFQFAD